MWFSIKYRLEQRSIPNIFILLLFSSFFKKEQVVLIIQQWNDRFHALMMVAISNCCFPTYWRKTQGFLFSIYFIPFPFLPFSLSSCFINLLLCILFIIDDEFVEKQHRQASKKTQRKDFVQRMHARNGNACFFWYLYIYIFISLNLLITDCMLRYISSPIFSFPFEIHLWLWYFLCFK